MKFKSFVLRITPTFIVDQPFIDHFRKTTCREARLIFLPKTSKYFNLLVDLATELAEVNKINYYTSRKTELREELFNLSKQDTLNKMFKGIEL